MQSAKYLVSFILCCIVLEGAEAQQTRKVPATVINLFDDLPIDDPGKNSILRPGEDSIRKIHNNILVKVSASSTHCFLGEPVMLTYELYSALQSTSTISNPPSFAGFSVYNMDAENEQVKRKELNGKTYRVFTLQQLQLTPLQEGNIIIDSMSVYNSVSYKEEKKMIHYGGTVTSTRINISVQALPAAGRPIDFSGATGIFTVKTVADTVAAAGENNTLHIEISGAGNFASVPLPAFEWPAGVEHFSVSTRQALDKHSFPPAGKKIFDIPFVATHDGELILPSVQLSFFDTQKKNYAFAHSLPIHIHVSAPLQRTVPVTAPVGDVSRPVSFYYWLMAICVLVIIGIFAWRKRRNKKDIAAPVNPALEEVSARTVSVEEKLQALKGIIDTTDYISGFKKILTEVLQKRIGVTFVSEGEILRQVHTADETMALQAAKLFEKCNVLLYAPAGLNSGTRAAMEEELAVLAATTNTSLISNNL